MTWIRVRPWARIFTWSKCGKPHLDWSVPAPWCSGTASREAPGNRPGPLGGSAFNGWTGTRRGKRKLPARDGEESSAGSQEARSRGLKNAACGLPEGAPQDHMVSGAIPETCAGTGARTPRARGETKGAKQNPARKPRAETRELGFRSDAARAAARAGTGRAR